MQPNANIAPPGLEERALGALAGKCPALVGYDPLSPGELAAPEESWRLAHREAPVQYLPDYEVWLVTSHDAVSEILLDTETFSSVGAFTHARIPDELKPRLPEGWPGLTVPALINNDPPEHTPIRKLAQKTLGPRYINGLEPQIRQIATEMLDRLVGVEECDLLIEFAKPFAVAVLAEMLGADDDAAAQFAQWSDDLFSVVNPALPADDVLDRGRRLVEFRDFLFETIESRRTDPRDDVVTALVQARDGEDDAVLTTPQIMAIASQLIVGGSESTASLISTTVFLALSRYPDIWQKMCDDPDAIPPVLEEMLRMRSPIRGTPRVTTREVELAGVCIPAGAKMVVAVAAANQDATYFPEPEKFDPTRTTRHLAFSRGRHHCIGSALARMDARVAIETLTQRLPGLKLQPDATPTWTPFLLGQGLTGLAVVLRSLGES
jgi:cytochrome P450